MFVGNPPHNYSYSVILCKQTHYSLQRKMLYYNKMLESARDI